MKMKKHNKQSMQRAAKKTSRARTTDRASPGIGHEVHVVIGALENPKYKWRTIKGISREVGIDPLNVHVVIEELGERVVKSNLVSLNGDELFTTRGHLKQKDSIISRIGAALRNRAA